jgi:hypothetical protein
MLSAAVVMRPSTGYMSILSIRITIAEVLVIMQTSPRGFTGSDLASLAHAFGADQFVHTTPLHNCCLELKLRSRALYTNILRWHYVRRDRKKC